LHAGRARFAVVYLAEAHAADQWPVGPAVSTCPAHRDLAARAAQCAGLARAGGAAGAGGLAHWPAGSVLVDGMDDAFLEHFGAWPTRFFVLRRAAGGAAVGGAADGVAPPLELAFKAQPGTADCQYNMADLALWLDQHLA
jgi:hypothetical protein